MFAKRFIYAALLIATTVGAGVTYADGWRGPRERPRREYRHEERREDRGWHRAPYFAPRRWVWAPGHWEMHWWIGPRGHREWRRFWVPPFRRYW